MAKPEYPVFQKTDKRLLGTWKSDALKTFAEWNWKKNTSPRKKKRLKAFFGKLEVTYTRSKVISRLRHRKWEQARRFLVIGRDDESAAILIFGKLEIKNRRQYDPSNLEFVEELCQRDQINHVHFDKSHYWISIGNGRNREFFRKVAKRPG